MARPTLRRLVFSFGLVLVVASPTFVVLPSANARGQEGGAQEPTLAFPAEVEQVTVDVVVTDKNGRTVGDLSAQDIRILEDGEPQEITSFDRFEVARPEEEPRPLAASPAGPPSPVSTNAEAEERRGRSFVLFFDDAHISQATAPSARKAIVDFLENETYDGDRVTLVAPGAGTWWTTRVPEGSDDLVELVKGLEGLLVPDRSRDRLSDYEAMRIHVFRDNMIIDRVHRRFATLNVPTVMPLDQHSRAMMATEEPYVTGRAAEVYYQATARNHVTLRALERALGSLAGFQGRKSVILLSEGFVYDTHLPEFKRILGASRRANAAVYFVDAGGLEGLPSGLDAEYGTMLPQEDIGFAFSSDFEETEGSMSIAADSGGFTVRNSNDLAGGLERIADETRSYYLIGYKPTNTARDGRFRSIEVEVPGRRGLTVRARKGYYAPSAEEAELAAGAADPQFQAALDSPYPMSDVSLRMTHFVREETFVDKARVFIAADVDVRDLQFEEEAGISTASLQFLMVTVHRGTGGFFRYDQKIDLRLPPDTRARLERTWLPIAREFELPPGRHRAKIVVRDRNTGRVGTVDHDFEVPELRKFRVSTPVLSDMREGAPGEAGGDQLALMARRDFPGGEPLYCQVDVFGATRLEESGRSRVSMGYEVRRADGTLVTGEAPSLINPTETGRVSRLIGFTLLGADLGDYTIVLRVRDELSGRVIERREPFRVTEPLPDTAAPPVPAAARALPGFDLSRSAGRE